MIWLDTTVEAAVRALGWALAIVRWQRRRRRRGHRALRASRPWKPRSEHSAGRSRSSAGNDVGGDAVTELCAPNRAGRSWLDVVRPQPWSGSRRRRNGYPFSTSRCQPSRSIMARRRATAALERVQAAAQRISFFDVEVRPPRPGCVRAAASRLRRTARRPTGPPELPAHRILPAATRLCPRCRFPPAPNSPPAHRPAGAAGPPDPGEPGATGSAAASGRSRTWHHQHHRHHPYRRYRRRRTRRHR